MQMSHEAAWWIGGVLFVSAFVVNYAIFRVKHERGVPDSLVQRAGSAVGDQPVRVSDSVRAEGVRVRQKASNGNGDSQRRWIQRGFYKRGKDKR